MAKPKDLKTTMKDKVLVAEFEEFCKKSLCNENFDFYTLTGKVNPPKHDAKKLSGSAVQNIYKRFIKAGSKDEINIDGDLRGEADELAGKKLFDDTRWDEVLQKCRGEVWSLMDKDTHPKFAKAHD